MSLDFFMVWGLYLWNNRGWGILPIIIITIISIIITTTASTTTITIVPREWKF